MKRSPGRQLVALQHPPRTCRETSGEHVAIAPGLESGQMMFRRPQALRAYE